MIIGILLLLLLSYMSCATGSFDNATYQENATDIYPVPCYGNKIYTHGVYPHIKLTKFEADAFCWSQGHNGGIASEPLLDAFAAIFRADNSLTSIVIWKGDVYTDLTDYSRWCLAFVWYTSGLQRLERIKLPCDEKHFFVCRNSTKEPAYFETYYNVLVENVIYGDWFVPPIRQSFSSNATICQQECFRSGDCFSFTFIEPDICNKTLTFPLSLSLFNESSELGYNVSLRTGCTFTVYNVSNVLDKRAFRRLIANSRIAPKNTTQYRKRFISTFYTTPYSVSVGAVAVVVIIVICALPIIFDIISFHQKNVNKTKKQKQRTQTRGHRVQPLNQAKKLDNTSKALTNSIDVTGRQLNRNKMFEFSQ